MDEATLRGILHKKAAEQNKCVKVRNSEASQLHRSGWEAGCVSDPKQATNPKFTHSSLAIELNV